MQLPRRFTTKSRWASDYAQLNGDMHSYNENQNKDEPIQRFFDFTMELAALEAVTT